MRSPISQPETAALITRLLAHYWTTQEPEAVRRSIAEDWLEDLAEFSPAILAAACREWRQTAGRRPLPSDIRRLCLAEQQAQHEHRTAIADGRDAWPRWLEELWGPAPDGPRLRAEAAAEARARLDKAMQEQRQRLERLT